MKILGSGKIDDFQKISFSDRVMDAMDAKPGDSVIFYKKSGESGVAMFRAEGSKLTNEVDAPMRNHLREAPAKLRTNMIGSILFIVLAMAVAAIGYNDMSIAYLSGILVFSVLGIVGLILSIMITQKIDAPSDGQSLISVGSLYSKNRLAGISKLSTDGYVVSGDLFVNSLFATNPSTVEVVFMFDNGTQILGLCKCIKSVPGYNVYRVRMKAEKLDTGLMLVNITYAYEGKTIEVTAKYSIGVNDGSNDILLTEGEVESKITFDEQLNNKEFDESLFDPNEEEL